MLNTYIYLSYEFEITVLISQPKLQRINEFKTEIDIYTTRVAVVGGRKYHGRENCDD